MTITPKMMKRRKQIEVKRSVSINTAPRGKYVDESRRVHILFYDPEDEKDRSIWVEMTCVEACRLGADLVRAGVTDIETALCGT